MGHGISGKDIAPFASELPIYEGKDLEDDSDALFCLLEPESWAEFFKEDCPEARQEDIEHPNVFGWRLEDVSYCGKKQKEQRCFAPEWRKGDFKVWLLNESQYNNVGYYEVTLVADDEASFQEFLKDFTSLFAGPHKMCQDQIIVQWN